MVTEKSELENDAIPFALAVASSIDTSPELRVKYEGENDAIPFVLAVALSIATSPEVTVK